MTPRAVARIPNSATIVARLFRWRVAALRRWRIPAVGSAIRHVGRVEVVGKTKGGRIRVHGRLIEPLRVEIPVRLAVPGMQGDSSELTESGQGIAGYFFKEV